MDPIRYGEGEGRRLVARGSEMFFKATAAMTQGRFSLMERTLPPYGRMPPRHFHETNDEAYYVLDGSVEFHVGDEDAFQGGPSTFVLVPAGLAHTFGNTSSEPARLLVLHAPALDGYFIDLDRLWAAEQLPSQDDELALMRQHGMTPTL